MAQQAETATTTGGPPEDKIPKGYQLWSSGIPNVQWRALEGPEKKKVEEYAHRWMVLAVIAGVLGVVSIVFYGKIGWWAFLIVAVCGLFSRDWVERAKALRRDLDAGYVNIFQGVGDPLLETQRGRLSIWMRFLREGWSRPLVDSGYFITAKWEEFELLPDSEALWKLEGVNVPLGTYSPCVVLASRGERNEEEVAFQLPAGQNRAEEDIGRRRLNDERRQEITDRQWVRMGKRQLSPAEKQELNQHIDAVRKLHRDLRLSLWLLTFLFVTVSVLGVWAFAQQFGGWAVFEKASMKIALGLLGTVVVLLIGAPVTVEKTFSKPILASLDYLEADLKTGKVEYVRLPDDPEKSKKPLQEALIESGIDWTLDGQPTPWRLVGYLDLELERLVHEGQKIDVTKKTLSQLADVVSADAQDAGATGLVFQTRAGSRLVEVSYSGRHILGEEMLPPIIAVAINKLQGEVHRGGRVQAGFLVGTLQQEFLEPMLVELSGMLETEPHRTADGAYVPLPQSDEPEVSDKWAFYAAKPKKKIRGLIEVQEIKD